MTRITFTIPDELLPQLQPLVDELTSDRWSEALEVKVRLIRELRREPVEPAAMPPPAALVALVDGRNKVLYHPVIPTRTLPVGTRGEAIRVYLLEHGPMSARALEAATGLGRKVIESTLWKLRSDGIIESREVAE